MISLIIPVYRNSENIEPLLTALQDLQSRMKDRLEVVFVVDGSPDDSCLRLSAGLPQSGLRAQLLNLSRNFGSFSAIRAGLEAARGDRFAVMAADLQEPPELVLEFDRILSENLADVVIGQRVGRKDPLFTRLGASLFWRFYRRFIQPEIPVGGVDIFGCRENVRVQLLKLQEINSSLVGLLFWVGFRRMTVPYERRKREHGESAWTLQKKLRYLLDSVYSFSDLPIRFLLRTGVAGLSLSFVLTVVVLAAKLLGGIPVPGYAATLLTITVFGALNCFGLGVIGNYVYRTFENTKQRPNFIVSSKDFFEHGNQTTRASALVLEEGVCNDKLLQASSGSR